MTKVIWFLRHGKPTVWTYAVTMTSFIMVAVSYLDRLMK